MLTGTVLHTQRLILRHWRDDEPDRAFFHRVNSEDAMLQFFPNRLDRAEADDLFDRMRARTAEIGHGWVVATDRKSGAPLGFTGIARIRFPEIGEGDEIGWRFVPEVWRQGLASEAALALLDHGFGAMGLPFIAAFAVHDNEASLAVMRRIGMSELPGRAFDHPAVPDERADLKRHRYYEITRADHMRK